MLIWAKLQKGTTMTKLLGPDTDGTSLNVASKKPQAHIDAIHKAIEKGKNCSMYWSSSLEFFPTKKPVLICKMDVINTNNGCSTHQN